MATMSTVRKQRVDEPYLKLDCELGEGPFWEPKSNVLRFVDIVKKNLHRVDLETGPTSHSIIAHLPISIGVTADIDGTSENIAFGGKHGYGILDLTTKDFHYIKKVWSAEEIAAGKEQRMRANDGNIDPKGRFWLGFMTDPEEVSGEPKPEGVLFRLDPDMSLHRMLEGVRIPNGISWSDDKKTMYFADSLTKGIDAFDYDLETGNISKRRVFFKWEGEGVPDGHCLDANGNMWTCICGGSKVLQISPQGQLLAEVELPTRFPTCPAICNEDLFVTSLAQEDEPQKYPLSAKYSGSLFSFDIGVKGQVKNKFRSQVQ